MECEIRELQGWGWKGGKQRKKEGLWKDYLWGLFSR